MYSAPTFCSQQFVRWGWFLDDVVPPNPFAKRRLASGERPHLPPDRSSSLSTFCPISASPSLGWSALKEKHMCRTRMQTAPVDLGERLNPQISGFLLLELRNLSLLLLPLWEHFCCTQQHSERGNTRALAVRHKIQSWRHLATVSAWCFKKTKHFPTGQRFTRDRFLSSFQQAICSTWSVSFRTGPIPSCFLFWESRRRSRQSGRV